MSKTTEQQWQELLANFGGGPAVPPPGDSGEEESGTTSPLTLGADRLTLGSSPLVQS